MPLPPTPPPPRRPSRPISRLSGRAPPPPARDRGEGLDGEATPPPWGPAPSLGNFEIVRSLGRGSRGEVLEVRRRSDGSRFALKRSLRPLSGPAQRRRWLRECHAQRGAGPGPGLLPLLAAWEQRGHFHLLTPLCAAGSLGHLWRKGARRGGASARGGVASVVRGVASPLLGVVSFLRGVVSVLTSLASPLLGLVSVLKGVVWPRRGVASSPRGVVCVLRGVASPLKGVVSFLRGAASRFWRETAKRGVALSPGGVASSAEGGTSSLRGVSSFLRGGASPEGMTSLPGGVSPPPAAAALPLAGHLQGGVANPPDPSSLATPLSDPSPSPNRLRGGVASPPAPSTSTTRPEVGAAEPEVGLVEPEVASSKPEVGSSEPEVGAAGRPMAEWRLRGYLWDLLVALGQLHARPLAHGDVKPDNVLLDAAGRCRLADFGLATPPGWEGGGAGEGGDPRYVAPEGVAGEGRPPGDIFSLALTVAELAGERRLPGAGEGWRRIRCGGGGRLPPGLGEGLSPQFQAVLAAMLDPDPRLRPSAPELLQGAWLKGAGRWRPLTRLADLGLRLLEDWLEAFPALLGRFRFRLGGWVWGPRTPPRPPRADPWTLRGEEEPGAPGGGEGSRSPSPTPDPRRTLTFEEEEPAPLPPPQ